VPCNAWTCRAKKDPARQRTRHPSRPATAGAWAAEAPPSGPAATDLWGGKRAQSGLDPLLGPGSARGAGGGIGAPELRPEPDGVGGVRRPGQAGRPALVPGATDREVFLSFLPQVLGPPLRPGAVVVRDNLAAHQNTDGAEALRQRGAPLCYWPPYSPDDHPMERAGSKIKTWLRGVGARTYKSYIVRCLPHWPQ